MNGLYIAWLLSVFVLFLVGMAAVLRFLEQRFPALHRWLDERFGPESGW